MFIIYKCVCVCVCVFVCCMWALCLLIKVKRVQEGMMMMMGNGIGFVFFVFFNFFFKFILLFYWTWSIHWRSCTGSPAFLKYWFSVSVFIYLGLNYFALLFTPLLAHRNHYRFLMPIRLLLPSPLKRWYLHALDDIVMLVYLFLKCHNVRWMVGSVCVCECECV